ncbi:hypothetical protein GCM10009843_38700 [Nocardioides bigeumensis]|uniref:Cardiolipin synthase N-terminal domain-containing protein n=2 Tax=Nocardioides bigeumensis TaxID=433657 RepID=A0ABP5KKB6_9ACTN
MSGCRHTEVETKVLHIGVAIGTDCGVLKMQLLFGVVTFALWVFSLVDVIQSGEDRIRYLPKLWWLLIVLLFPLVGSIGWLVAGRPAGAGGPRSAYERQQPAFPEYDRPGRAAAADPEKDEAFLRQVRARAEEQRRRHEAERRKREQEQGGDG